MKGLSAATLALLYQKFAESGANTIPGGWLADATVGLDKLIVSELDARFASAAQGSSAESALQPGDAATTSQGAKADTALQPTDNIVNTIAGVAAATLVAQAATAFGWGNHASAGYRTDTLKVYQAVATGASPETFTLPAAPASGSEVIVLVEQASQHYTPTDPPAAGDFYRSGASVKVDTTAGDRVSIYYMG